MDVANMNEQVSGIVVLISHIPATPLDRGLKRGIVKALTEGGGIRELHPGDCVAENEMIIADNGMCAVVEYVMDTGTLVKVFM